MLARSPFGFRRIRSGSGGGDATDADENGDGIKESGVGTGGEIGRKGGRLRARYGWGEVTGQGELSAGEGQSCEMARLLWWKDESVFGWGSA
jgi:hypothetical protein